MMIKIVFQTCLMLFFGFGENKALANEVKPQLVLEQSWEAQHFLNADFLVEEESDDQFVALRERRDTGTSMNNDCNSSVCEDSSSGRDIDKCANITHPPCHTNATCHNTDGSYYCTCKAGFSGDGNICNAIEDCKTPEVCSMNATCKGPAGSITCTCNDNFYGDGNTCREISKRYSTIKVYTKIGEKAILVCTLDETIVWIKNGKPIENTEKSRSYKNILIINPEDDDDFGEYFCELKAHKGRGISMSLAKTEDSSSEKYLIPMIIFLILLLVAIVVIIYLVHSRRRISIRGPEKNYKDENALYALPTGNINQNNDYTDDIYTDLNCGREEPVYQGLVDTQTESTDVNTGASGSNTNPGMYEAVDYNLNRP